MDYQRSPLRIEVRQLFSKDLVRVINIKAYVFRQSKEGTPDPKKYWLPCGAYFVRFLGRKIPVTFATNEFVAQISVPDFLWIHANMPKKEHHVSSREPSAA